MTNFILCECFTPAVSGFFLDLFQNLLAGGILLWMGLFFYKKIKKKQAKEDIEVEVDFKIENIISTFKRLRKKYDKPMGKDSHGTGAEEDYSKLSQACEEAIKLIEYYHLEEYSDLHLISNWSTSIVGVLVWNNPIVPNEDKIGLLFNMKIPKGMTFNKESMINYYFENYTFFSDQIEKRIESGEFLKKNGFKK